MNEYIIKYLIIINIITLIIFGFDKLFALKKKRRVSERNLILLSFLGGCFFELIGMFLFRHKTKKFKFYFFNIVLSILYLIILIKKHIIF